MHYNTYNLISGIMYSISGILFIISALTHDSKTIVILNVISAICLIAAGILAFLTYHNNKDKGNE